MLSQRTLSSVFRAVFYTVKLHSLTQSVWGPLENKTVWILGEPDTLQYKKKKLGSLYKNKQTTKFALLITFNKYNKFNQAVYA